VRVAGEDGLQRGNRGEGRIYSSGAEFAACPNRCELRRRPLGDVAGLGGCAVQRRIVEDHEDTIRRQVHVQLEAVGAAGKTRVERGQGVFGPEGTAASVGEDEWTGRVEEAQGVLRATG